MQRWFFFAQCDWLSDSEDSKNICFLTGHKNHSVLAPVVCCILPLPDLIVWKLSGSAALKKKKPSLIPLWEQTSALDLCFMRFHVNWINSEAKQTHSSRLFFFFTFSCLQLNLCSYVPMTTWLNVSSGIFEMPSQFGSKIKTKQSLIKLKQRNIMRLFNSLHDV